MTRHFLLALWALMLLCAAPAHALQITSLSPQGEVSQVRQVVAQFDQPAVNFGDARAPNPLRLTCNDPAATQGNGRWISDREWTFQFAHDLPVGIRCTVEADAAFVGKDGQRLTGPTRWTFNTGGPAVLGVRPHNGAQIDESQAFVFGLSGPATAQSLQQASFCRIDGLGEQVPVRLITGPRRTELLRAMGLEADDTARPGTVWVLECARRLPAGAAVSLVYGAGVQTPSGLASRTEKRFSFKVREPFAASFTCERENAQAGCLPIRAMELQFNAEVDRRLAQQIRLFDGKQRLAPVFGDDAQTTISSVRFAPPFAEDTRFTLELPAGLTDVDGRPLRNAANFPLTVRTGPMPPLAKFPAAPFGIVERHAEGVGKEQALLPVTLRKVALAQGVSDYRLADLRPQSDAEIIDWFRRVQRMSDFFVDRELASRWVRAPLPPVLHETDGTPINPDRVQTRMVSLLAGQPGVQRIDLPAPPAGKPRPFEVVGIPLKPGFHVVEISSGTLGRSLLDPRYGADRRMVVRTSVLVTNLNVSVKIGRENALVWVTTLDRARPVRGAAVQVSGCDGKLLASGTTDTDGIARISGLSPEPPYCRDTGDDLGYFVSARARDGGVEDMAFAWSGWNEGFEPWRFDLPTSASPSPSEVAHTVFDRTLLRAGETVSMKHFIRVQTLRGLALPEHWPDTLVITHAGSGQQSTQLLQWQRTPSGGMAATSQFAIPKNAKLGVYSVSLRSGSADDTTDEQAVYGGLDSGSFRVEEFRLPVFSGSVLPSLKAPLVRPASLPVVVNVRYTAGGPASGLPVTVSALLQPTTAQFDGYDAYSFARARSSRDNADASDEGQLIADKLPLTLDRQGNGRVDIAPVPPAPAPRALRIEASYSDPNGEVQTVSSTQTLWPAAVVAGIKTGGSWVSAGQSVPVQAVALSPQGKPVADVPMTVKAIAHITTTTRKRMVGGFYAYDNKTSTRDLGTVCSGKSDANGRFDCQASLAQPGEIELIVQASDAQGRHTSASTSVWVTRAGELWFGGDNHDRIDILPEKRSYKPGETAAFQVRMPFRRAKALVTVEREGVMHSQVVDLDGSDPTVRLKVDAAWAPNAYVSVLVLRGRLYEVPWYSFFTWGYKTPIEWWRMFWGDSKDYVAPTAMVDLSKPSFRFGVAPIRVGVEDHRIKVDVQTDKPTYPVRGKAQVRISATLPDGKPAAGADVAVAAVDQALLELLPNTSWDLLGAMMAERAWGVSTATAQSEVIGRRHYGLKAVPAGGGGGKTVTRELFDTLLLWRPNVALDAQGRAVLEVPLNDSLTTFRIVAVAEHGLQRFGTGQTTLRTTQDLQLLSGLPPLVREGDRFDATFTVRNTTRQAMQVELTPAATGIALAPQRIDLPAESAREVRWSVEVPMSSTPDGAAPLVWQLQARDTLHGAKDALRVQQQVVAAVPLAVQQATLRQVDGTLSLDVAPPVGALTDGRGAVRGGIKIALQPTLAAGLDGVRDWFLRYPFGCLEQRTSIALGLVDRQRWAAVVNDLPTYLDEDGLANYFPVRAGDGNRGSDILTAYLLAASDQAARLDPAFALPADLKKQLQNALIAFVEGRIERKFWSPRNDLDTRKLAAIEALSRDGKARARMLDSLTVAPNQWPTSAVIDWLAILQRLPDAPQRAQRLAEAQSILKSRLSWQGTKLVFSTEREDDWWWLMSGGDVNTARLMLTVMRDPTWRDDLPRLATGFLARQQRGAWQTTTANLWGSLALREFVRQFESEPVSGQTRITLGDRHASIDWSRVATRTAASASGSLHSGRTLGQPAAADNWAHTTAFLPWPAAATAQPLQLQQQGSGKPWATVQSWAAVPLKTAFDAGYGIKKTIEPVEQAQAGKWSRGDVARVTLEVNASSDMTWVAISDPIPGGATLLGSGLGGDSALATRGERSDGTGWLAYEERSFSGYRAYYEYLPKGKVTLQYTLRLNNVGQFALPPTRVEALYAPEMFGEAPNTAWTVLPRP